MCLLVLQGWSRCYQVILFTVIITTSLKLIYHRSAAHFGNIAGTIFHNQDFSGPENFLLKLSSSQHKGTPWLYWGRKLVSFLTRVQMVCVWAGGTSSSVPRFPTAPLRSRKPSVSRNQGVISRQHWWIVFPFTGTKTKEGVVQSVTSGKSTARVGCGNLWWFLDPLGRSPARWEISVGHHCSAWPSQWWMEAACQEQWFRVWHLQWTRVRENI